MTEKKITEWHKDFKKDRKVQLSIPLVSKGKYKGLILALYKTRNMDSI
jgi:hypothetical protein